MSGPVARRGATWNPPNRYSGTNRETVIEELYTRPDHIPTRIKEESIRNVLTTSTSPDLEFDRTLNPYRGCEHGCIYCYARPTHAYYDLSPGLDFETRIFARTGAGEQLAKEINRKKFSPRRTILGAIADCYQPAERKFQVTRKILQVLAKHSHPIGIATRSDLILRDLDLLAPMAERNLVSVAMSVTTLQEDLRRKMEPGAPSAERRFRAIHKLRQEGIPVFVFLAPIIPGLTDHEMEAILERAKEAGASGATGILLRLPGEVLPLFTSWLSHHYPEKKNRILSLLRSMRGGKHYDSRYGYRMSGTGPHASLLFQRFAKAKKRLGLMEELPRLNFDLFQKFERNDQLELFL